MTCTLRAKMKAGFGFLLGTLLTIGLILFQSTNGLIANSRWLDRTHDVLTELERTIALMSATEAATRGYLITGQDVYLDPALKSRSGRHVENLYSLVADNPLQQQRVALLKRLWADKVKFMEEAIRLRRAHGFEAGAQHILTGRGKRLMDDVREAVDTIQDEEQRLLRSRTENLNASIKRAKLGFFLMSTLASGTFAVLCFFAARYTTEQRRAKEGFARLGAIVEFCEEAIIGGSLDGVITSWNVGSAGIYGYSAEEIVGRPISVLVPPGQSDETPQVLARIKAGQRVEPYETERLRRDGRRIRIFMSVSPIKDAEGRITGISTIARDITEGKMAEEKLAAERRLMRTLIDNLPDYIFAKDIQSRMILSNQAHARALGATTPDEVLGRRDFDFVPQDLAERYYADEQAVIRSGQTCSKEEQSVDHLGNRIWVSTIKAPLRDADRKIIGIVGVSHNITESKQMAQLLEKRVEERTADLSNLNKLLEAEIHERKDLENELRRKNSELEQQNRLVKEANRYKSEFLANMSHELRTPLNCIIGFSELMFDEKIAPVSPDLKEYLGDVLNNSRHLLSLINGVLDLAKVEAGEMEFEPEPADVTKLINEVKEVLHSVAIKNRIHVSVAVDPLLKEVVIDASKLKQVFYNYLSNALKFTPEEGRVTISVQAQGEDHFRMEVKDTGIGIQPQDRARLFVEFQQLDATTGKKFQGTGLGLALTRRIVEAQGGQVGVESTPGEGSLFFAVLPRVSRVAGKADLQSMKESGVAAGSQASAVLVIEDEPKERAWMRKTLSKAGYAVETAANGAEALAKCNKNTFAALTLDLLLRNESGWDVLRKIRAQGPNRQTPVIVASVVKERTAATAFPVEDILTKPVQPEDLLASLHRAGVLPEKALQS